MNRYALAALSCLVALGALSAHADINYPTPGSPVYSTTIVATTTGNLTGFYLAQNAGGEDTIRLIDKTTGFIGSFTMDNRTSAVNQAFNLGPVNKGDVLAFEIHDNDLFDPNNIYLQSGFPPNPVESSDPTQGTDGISHTYAASYSGSIDGLSDLTAFSFEDLPAYVSDLDYNDIQIAVSGVTATNVVTPEPGTFVLLGTGLVGAVGTLRRRLAR